MARIRINTRNHTKEKPFSKKKTITFFWSKLTTHRKDPILHVTTTFSLKQGETRTSSGPIPHLLNRHWTSATSSPPSLFPKKVGIFIPSEVLAWVMTACWVLPSRLTYFWRNMNISGISYFSKSTSINTQYSSLWDTLKMMLFTKYLIKWKCIGRISWKFSIGLIYNPL